MLNVVNWYRLIAPFQKGETPTFVQHVKASLAEFQESTLRNEAGVLVFSGFVLRTYQYQGKEKLLTYCIN